MIPTWLLVLAVVSLALAFMSAAIILVDELRGHHPLMPVMQWVWPITALYMGPGAIVAYWTMDRTAPMQQRAPNGGGQDAQPFWQLVFKGVTHCGAGCTLGDIIGEWGIFISAATLAGLEIWPDYVADYILAYVLGIAFQYQTSPQHGVHIPVISMTDGSW